jgi:hypothetical protein
MPAVSTETGADLDLLETRADANGNLLVPLRELAEALGTTRQSLNRIARERGIDRVRYPLDRRTWVPLDRMRAALAEPHRRPGHQTPVGGQDRGPDGRFA